MNKVDCEIVCMAAMAKADGYTSDLSPDRIEAHLAECAGCRREVGQLRALASLLDTQERQQRNENVWKQVELRLPQGAASQSAPQVLYPFILLGVLLLGYRLVQLVPDRELGFLFNFVPVLFVIAVFIYLKENPFKVHSELRLEGE